MAITGPAASAQQSGFALNWLETTGEILSGERFFPEPHSEIGEDGGVEVQTILSSPALGAGSVGTMYLAAVQCAKKELLIANHYFIPDARVIDMLGAAYRSHQYSFSDLISGHAGTEFVDHSGYSPRTMCTSVPQIVVRRTCITASPAPAVGIFFSARPNSPFARNTFAHIKLF